MGLLLLAGGVEEDLNPPDIISVHHYFLVDVMSNSAFITVDLMSFRHYFPYKVLSLRRFFYHSTFFSVDSSFRSTFCPSTFFYYRRFLLRRFIGESSRQCSRPKFRQPHIGLRGMH
jgi:hypothetical protein